MSNEHERTDTAAGPGAGDPGDWLTTRQVAALHGVSVVTVGNWIRQGILPAIRPGWEYLVLRSDAEAFRKPDRWSRRRGAKFAFNEN